MELRPYTVAVPESVFVDLRERLGRTRWPDEVADAGWDFGVPLSYPQELTAYWRDASDWRVQERRINTFAHYRADLDGFGLHFIHQRGAGPRPRPLLLLHGWPSSFVESLDLLPLLADPAAYGGDSADSFDVVVPSLPGYGFSDWPTTRGFGYNRAAERMAALMAGLGYDRYGIHAHDHGAAIAAQLCLRHPERVVGYHTSEPVLPRPELGPGAAALTAAERAYLAVVERWREGDNGYARIQATRPQTLAYGLVDSPAGLAAWLGVRQPSDRKCTLRIYPGSMPEKAPAR